MSNIIRVNFPTGSNLYVQFQKDDEDGDIWNGSSYVPLVVASWTTYAIAMGESPASSGKYSVEFPASSPVGNYLWSIYLRAGGSPASTDVSFSGGSAYWDGTNLGPPPSTLGPDSWDLIIVEPAAGSQPEINAKQALGLVFDAAIYGIMTGVSSGNPVSVFNPAGNINRAIITTDTVGNRFSIEFKNLP